MLSRIKHSFDEYIIKARVIPALIAFSPILLIPLIFVDATQSKILTIIGEALLLIPLLTLLSGIMQAAGNKYQQKIIRVWDGLPSTRYLREQDQTLGIEVKRNIYKLIKKTFDISIDGKNDNEIIGVFDRMKAYLRDREPKALYQRHNINYGFYRNLSGTRWYSLVGAFTVVFGYWVLSQCGIIKPELGDMLVLGAILFLQLLPLSAPYLCKINAEHYAREALHLFAFWLRRK
ncbi:hypothetical protein L0244_33715 [bacterium]|nr:hypothetical protein [bacterium]